MEKSIETIWKDGFLRSDALVAPKLNDLYNQKSTHIIDKIIRMGRINLYAIVIGSSILLTVCLIAGAILGGIILFVALNYLVWMGVQQAKGLKEINKGNSSYEYIKAFDGWLKANTEKFRRVYRYVYPIIFGAAMYGFWEYSHEKLMPELLAQNPDMTFIFGIPLYGFIFGLSVIVLSAVFSGPLYRLDVKSVYGPVLRKLAEILKDMEELRA